MEEYNNFANVQNSLVVNTTVADWEFINTHPQIYGNASNWLASDPNTFGNVHYQIEYTANGVIKIPDGKEPFRANPAFVGCIYDTVHDVFYAQQPYPSWTLNTTTWLWEAPIKMPEDGSSYVWDEPSLTWRKIVSE